MQYKIYFTFYGRKYKTEIESINKPTDREIRETLMQYLDLVKVEEVSAVDDLKKIFGMVK